MPFDKYVIVINSTDYYQRFTNVNDQTYLFNNTNIPEGNYKCRWSYRSSLENTAAPNVFPTIYLRGQTIQQAFSANSTGGNMPSFCLGSARQAINTTSATSYYFAGPQDNTNFYWSYRPGYELRVTLRSGISLTNLYAGSSEYILMIEMEKVGN
jgi:hypothetical protein